MGTITIPDINDSVLSYFERQAAEHGVTLEDEIRRLLTLTYGDPGSEAVKNILGARG